MAEAVPTIRYCLREAGAVGGCRAPVQRRSGGMLSVMAAACAWVLSLLASAERRAGGGEPGAGIGEGRRAVVRACRHPTLASLSGVSAKLRHRHAVPHRRAALLRRVEWRHDHPR